MDGERPIRVLWAIKGLGPGGAEHLLVSAAGLHDREAFDLEVAYMLDWKDRLAPRLRDLGVRVHCLDVARTADLRWVWRLGRLVASGRYDIVHVHSPLMAAVTRVLALRHRRDGLRVVSTEHNVWSSYSGATRLLNRMTYPLGEAVIAVSTEVAHSVTPKLQHLVEVIEHGIIVDDVRAQRRHRDEVRAELGIGPDEILVGTVANLRVNKAYPDLLEAVAALRDRGVAARFVAVGQGPLEEELRARVDELGIGDRFRLLGYRADAVRVVAGFDLFVLPSLYEGFPIAVMEALGVGVPVVATRVGGIPVAVRHGQEGLLVQPGDWEGLAAALERVITDDDLRARMAAAAYERGGDYDIAKAVARIEEIYHRVAGPVVSRRSA